MRKPPPKGTAEGGGRPEDGRRRLLEDEAVEESRGWYITENVMLNIRPGSPQMQAHG